MRPLVPGDFDMTKLPELEAAIARLPKTPSNRRVQALVRAARADANTADPHLAQGLDALADLLSTVLDANTTPR